MEFHNAVLLLGGNEGDRMQSLKSALEQIENKGGRLVSRSSVYETEPWGKKDQPSFLNMAVHIETRLNAIDLLYVLKSIEEGAGRERTVRWGPRTLDIDILFYDAEIMDTGTLQIPHPRLQDRRFALAPLAQICPDWVHPVLKQTVRVLTEKCKDESNVYIHSENL